MGRVLSSFGYFKIRMSPEEVESIVLRALHDMSIDYKHRRGGLTLFEAKIWVGSLVSKSPYLASLFGTHWEHGELGAYQRQMIGMVHQFEMGMISLPDLKYHAAKSR